jgi:AcrR family transcriptional regulator
MVEAILEAAARVLSKHGFADTTTNLIASTAGISIGSLYQYFGNKHEIISALHVRHSYQLLERIQATAAKTEGESLPRALAALVDAVIDEHLVDPSLHRILEIEFPSYEPAFAEHEADQKILGFFRAFLESHRGNTAVPDLDIAAYFILRTLFSLSHALILEARSGRVPLAQRSAVAEMLYGYLALDRGSFR